MSSPSESVVSGDTPLSVLGSPLQACCFSPKTGFYRDGYCRTSEKDTGKHIICAEMTDAFLSFSLQCGNNLITPLPQFNFPGLVAGDRWCLCISRWKEAYNAGVAPGVVLESCHENCLTYVSLEILKRHAVASSH